MTISSTICTSFKQEMLQGQHDVLNNTFKLALYTTSANLGADTTAYITDGEASGAGYTAGGVTLTGNTIWTDGSTVGISFDNVTIPTVGTMSVSDVIGALIYNSSVSNKALATIFFGSTYTLTNDILTIVVPINTALNGLIKFGG